MSKKKAETMTLWLTRDTHDYRLWMVKPRKDRHVEWTWSPNSKGICVEYFNRRFPKAWRLKRGAAPVECVLTVKAKT